MKKTEIYCDGCKAQMGTKTPTLKTTIGDGYPINIQVTTAAVAARKGAPNSPAIIGRPEADFCAACITAAVRAHLDSLAAA